ncbi:MAG: hypothetical protein ACT4P7_11010 [Gemmatimonadaceae bacterium]
MPTTEPKDAIPILEVHDVESAVRFYVDRLGLITAVVSTLLIARAADNQASLDAGNGVAHAASR